MRWQLNARFSYFDQEKAGEAGPGRKKDGEKDPITAGASPLPPYVPGRNRPTRVPFPGKNPFPDTSYYEMTREAAQMVGVGRRWDDYEPGPAPGPQG